MIESIVYLNGKFLPEKEATIPVSDRGFLFGDGIFTTIRVEDGRPEFLGLHLKKLIVDCEEVGIAPQEVSEEMVYRLIEKNHAENGVWRLKIIMTGGDGPGITLDKRSGQFLMTIKPYGGFISPCRLVSYPHPISSPIGKFKSLAYLDRLWIADYASKQGFDDALVCNHAGKILETSIANVFWRKGNDLFFPDHSLSLYQGITLQMVLSAAERMGMNIFPVSVGLEEIPDEVQFYLCNSLKRMVPVAAIDEKSYARDLIFEEALQKAYKQLKLMNIPKNAIRISGEALSL